MTVHLFPTNVYFHCIVNKDVERDFGMLEISIEVDIPTHDKI
jgi:hypothetical protein